MAQHFNLEEHEKRIRRALTPQTPLASIRQRLRGFKLPRIKRRG